MEKNQLYIPSQKYVSFRFLVLSISSLLVPAFCSTHSLFLFSVQATLKIYRKTTIVRHDLISSKYNSRSNVAARVGQTKAFHDLILGGMLTL